MCVHRKLGSSSGITRKRYSVLQKCQVIEYALDLQERYGTSVRNVALDIQVPQNVLARWCGQVVQLREQAKIVSKSLSLGAGPVCQLKAVQDQLHSWLFKKREHGMAISIAHIVWKAQKFIGPDFTNKSFNAKFHMTQRWLRRFSYVYRMRTNEATQAPAVVAVAGEALAFLLATRLSLVSPHRDKSYIFNLAGNVGVVSGIFPPKTTDMPTCWCHVADTTQTTSATLHRVGSPDVVSMLFRLA
jgi:hypothetical protein